MAITKFLLKLGLFYFFQTGRHRGIMGIERSIQQKQKVTDSNITQSFQDLSKLIEKVPFAIVLSVLLRYTDSDCPFAIFKLFLQCRNSFILKIKEKL